LKQTITSSRRNRNKVGLVRWAARIRNGLNRFRGHMLPLSHVGLGLSTLSRGM